MSDAKGRCPECGTDDVRLTNAGRLYKHPGSDGEACLGTGQEPAPADAVVPVDLVDEDPDDWGDEPSEDAGKPEPTAADSAGSASVYDWVLPIQQPALYLDDVAWHYANAQAAAAAAEAAGHTVAGEAKCTSIQANEDGTGLDLTYTVPLEAPRG
ncbi:hypothetical protein Aph01nite_43700 [Acrocarpospora phusangensis]|uniref:Uncharacterized protein n=1 Tax=Acrocarpospora phusangensis TaxID=1070424 RepID=A0A919US27_9ACTN|nr:hypothetical protein [Acrocarpospora phusangensis]GIH26060.1 hypothetical protein Aph01nite_43700 [Acrocarpospora phusangensis]